MLPSRFSETQIDKCDQTRKFAKRQRSNEHFPKLDPKTKNSNTNSPTTTFKSKQTSKRQRIFRRLNRTSTPSKMPVNEQSSIWPEWRRFCGVSVRGRRVRIVNFSRRLPRALPVSRRSAAKECFREPFVSAV